MSWKCAASFSRGTLFATAGEDTTAKLWNLRTGKEVLTLTGQSFALTGVAFSPDGTRLATSSGDGTVRVYAVSLAAFTLASVACAFAGTIGQPPGSTVRPPTPCKTSASKPLTKKEVITCRKLA